MDIACGSGYGSYTLLNEGEAQSVLGVDYSPQNVEYCRNHYRQEKLRFEVGDISNLHLGAKFDLIVCFETIEHVENFKNALKCLHEALSDDGILIISSPNREITNPYLGPDVPTMDGAHKREFTPEEFLHHLNETGFREEGYYGQRLQKRFSNPFWEKHYKRFFKPSRKASPTVNNCHEYPKLTPEYIVFAVRKATASIDADHRTIS